MNNARVLAIGSLLLQYPSEQIKSVTKDIRTEMSFLSGDDAGDISQFLDWVDTTSLLDAQSHYVSIFDRKRRACLYLSYYLNGDTRRRGMALVRFKELYAEFGLLASDEELPDFLPTVLQFAAAYNHEVGMQVLSEHYSGIEVLHKALVDAKSPYAHVVHPLVRNIPKSESADTDTHRLITEGVPAELVGLEPFALGERVGG